MKKASLIFSLAAGLAIPTLSSSQDASTCISQQLACGNQCKDASCVARCTAEAQSCINRSASGSGGSTSDRIPPKPPTAGAPSMSNPYRSSTSNGRRQPDGVAAPNCAQSKRLQGGFNVADIVVQNTCSFTIELNGTCLSPENTPQKDYPFPGVYSFHSSGLKTLGPGKSQPDPLADVCVQRGGRMVYASCRVGTPYHTTPDGQKYNCYK